MVHNKKVGRITKKSLLIPGLFVALLVTYQNCMQDPPPAQQASGPLPFAFETTVDTLAHMGCHSMSVNASNQEFFTFRALARDQKKAGLQLTSDFKAAIANFPPYKKVSAIRDDPVNKGAWLNFALRAKSDLVNSIYGYPQGSAMIDPILDRLSDPNRPDSTNPYSSLLLNLPDGQKLTFGGALQGTLNFQTAPPSTHLEIRNFLSTETAYLALTYLEDQEDRKAKASSTGAWGRGITASFQCPTTQCKTYFLYQLREYDLGNNTYTRTTWTCDTRYRFRIINPGDATAAGCDFSKTPDPAIASIAQAVLGTNWQIDTANFCVMPPSSSFGACYFQATQGVEYDPLADCENPPNAPKACVQYLSFCAR